MLWGLASECSLSMRPAVGSIRALEGSVGVPTDKLITGKSPGSAEQASLLQTLARLLCFLWVIKAPNHLEKKEMTSLIEMTSLTDHAPSLREAKVETQSRKLETRTEAENMEEGCLLLCSPGLAQVALL